MGTKKQKCTALMAILFWCVSFSSISYAKEGFIKVNGFPHNFSLIFGLLPSINFGCQKKDSLGSALSVLAQRREGVLFPGNRNKPLFDLSVKTCTIGLLYSL